MPRLMARSMVSNGTDESRAFWYIVRSVGFMSGSPPPWRAATSTWRISLAKSLPRFWSAAPFLCLMVAHLEWPDMQKGPFGGWLAVPDRATATICGCGDPGTLGARTVDGLPGPGGPLRLRLVKDVG